jgi:hypothetical protein
LYKALASFFAISPGVTVHAYGLPASVEAETDIEVNGIKNGTNLIYTVPYSPAITGSNPEFFLMNTGHISDAYLTSKSLTWETVSGTWYNITSGFEMNVVDSVWDGVININASGLIFSGATLGAISGIIPNANDRMRVDVTPYPLNDAFKELISPEYRFQFFTFAYDPDLANEYKFSGTNLYSGKSWLSDAKMGKAMAANFNISQQRTIFVQSLPEKVRPNQTLTGFYATGTAYSTNGYKWEELKNIVGTTAYTVLAGAKQNTIGTTASTLAAGSALDAVDPAIALIATKMLDPYRWSITHRLAQLSNGIQPNVNEVFRWRDSQINMAWTKPGDGSNHSWASNTTLGAGNEASINFVLCRNLFAYKIITYLNNVLNSGGLFYDVDGIRRVKAAIEAAGIEAYEVDKIIDGYVTVTIPMQRYVENEANLSAAEAAVLAAARATKVLGSIIVQFPWNGDIEVIEVSALVPG